MDGAAFVPAVLAPLASHLQAASGHSLPLGVHTWLSPLQLAWLAFGSLALLALALAWIVWLRRRDHERLAQLRRSDSYHRALLHFASDAVFVHDIEGAGLDLNAAAREAFGLRRDEAIPSLFDVVAAPYHDRVEAHLVVLRANGTARCDLGIVTSHGGTPPLYEFESRLLDADGGHHVLSVARDVQARRAYEDELITARRQAEEAAKLKSAFLANMSHEIRTPLTAVIGYAEILRDEVAREHRDLATIIERGGTRLLDTLNSVLDLARLDSGTEALHPRPLDASDRVRQSVALLRPLAESKRLTLDDTGVAATASVLLDASALDRVTTNLVSNAIKFTEAGTVSVSLRADGPEIVLQVADTGIGIDAAFLPELFSEFRQESEGDARRHEGSGLGLAITQRLVSLMGGTISVDSAKGEGTVFTVTLPRIAPGAAAHEGVAFPTEAVLDPASRQV